MPLPGRILKARDRLKEHLDQRDWSDLTPGRERLLGVFLKLATADGYSAVTMRALAKETNIKASSLYFHFPGGRSEIVAESLRWHYANWGYALLDAIAGAKTASEFWDSLVGTTLRLQVSLPASDLWDLLVRMDRVGGFLEPEFRQEIDYWLELCAGLFEAAAQEMGHTSTKRTVRAIMSVIDSGSSWCEWEGNPGLLEDCCAHVIKLSRAMLATSNVQGGATST